MAEGRGQASESGSGRWKEKSHHRSSRAAGVSEQWGGSMSMTSVAPAATCPEDKEEGDDRRILTVLQDCSVGDRHN